MIDYYIVYQGGVDVAHVTSTATTINSLIDGQIYSFAVAAHNAAGGGARTSSMSSIPLTVPNVPTDLTSIIGNGQVALNWTAPSSNGGAAIDYYIVYQNGADVQHVSATSFTVTGLTNGQSYSFMVAAHNPAGVGGQTLPVSSTPLTVPGVPIGLAATAGNGQATLNWTAPSSTGGAAVDYYIVYQNGVDVKQVSGTSYSMAGLTNGQSYSFTVAAHNSAGTGAQTSPVGSMPLTVPDVATGLTAIAGNGQVALNWTAPSSNGGAAIDYYVICQNGVDVKHVTSTSCMITGLTNGQSYSFNVAAHNSAGTGSQTSAVGSVPITVPGVPVGLTAIAGNDQVTLNWTAPSSTGGATIDSYVVYQNGADVQHISGTSYTAAGLSNGLGYSFAVAAHNVAGIGPQTSSVSSIPLTVPNAPSGLTAISGNGQVTLNWTAPSSNGGAAVDYYVVYQGGVDVKHASSTSLIVTGLTNGQSYSFMVAAHNPAGVGGQTLPVSSTPLAVPGVPTGLTGIAGDGQVTLNWTAPSFNGGVVVDYYIVYQGGVDVKHASSTSLIVAGLTNGQSYSFTVAAHNSAGTGAQTLPIGPTPFGLPGVPAGLTAAAGNGQVTLNWTAPSSNHGAAIDYYVVYQGGVDVTQVGSTSATINGLTNGQSYSFTVAAHNAAGIGARTLSVGSTPLMIPGAPTGLTAIAGNGQVALNWTAPSSNGGATIDYYIVYQNGVDIAHPAVAKFTSTGLTRQSYSFIVATHTAAGKGPNSSEVLSTPFTVPSIPTGLTAAAGNGQVTLNWTAPSSNGGATIDYYVVYQGGVDVKHVSGMSYAVIGLTNGQSYSFKVAAHNTAGIGSPTTSLISTPLAVPGVPAGLTALSGNGQVTLNWTAPPSNGGAAIDYYVIYQGGIDVKHVSTKSFVVTGLTNGQSYSFAVAAHNSAGIGPRTLSVGSIPITVSNAPTGLIAIAGNSQVTLNWTAPILNGGATIDYYIVYQGGVDVKHVTSSSLVVAGLTNGQSYSFKVAAHNLAGVGATTPSVSSTPVKPSTPTGWGAAKLLETTSGNASTPQVAVSANGNAMAVWQQYDGAHYNIYARSYASGAWGTTQLIETGSGIADSPQVAMDSNGNAIVVWRQYDGAYYSIYANRYTAGTWGAAKLLETATGDTQTPQIAMDNNGNAIAVWTQYDGAYYSTYANRYTAGAWGTAKLLETATGIAQTPQIAMDSNGNAMVVWVQLDSVWRLSIYASKYTNAVGWGAVKLLETSNVDATTPQVAVDNNGNAFAVWAQGGNIYADRYTAGVWGTAKLLETSAVWATGPQVSMDNNGNAVVIWTLGGNIYADRFSAGAWGTATLLNTSAGWGMSQQVAMDNKGNAVVIWAQGGSIYTNRYSAGAWGKAQLIETIAGNAFVPQVALDGSGNAVAVWQQNNGPNLSIYENVFAAV